MERSTTEFRSLRKISIPWSRLDQRMVDTLLASCSRVLEELILLKCKGLKLLRLAEFSKLRVLRVLVEGLNRVTINAPNLHCICLTELDRSCSVNVASCTNLVKLSLHICSITNDFFNRGLANFTCLQSLSVWMCSPLKL
uniref:Uncharacterized protein n=1 Tax=Opuntia streptacantha TaxID=393608 RepID=A0A7C8ZWP5_OPUST